jgi:hypothetical protein
MKEIESERKTRPLPIEQERQGRFLGLAGKQYISWRARIEFMTTPCDPKYTILAGFGQRG